MPAIAYFRIMVKNVFAFLFVLFSYSTLAAQCDQCAAISGESIDHCFTHADAPGRCAQFSEDAKTFYYEDQSRKKNKVMQFPMPEGGGKATMPYLLSLQKDKKLKMKAADLLFIAAALENWRQIEAIRTWSLKTVKSGYTILPSGLAYKIIKEGTGKQPSTGKSVTVHYTGYLEDGKKFDSSLDRKQSFKFSIGKGQVIKGWDEGVALMKTGARYLFRIPSDLAYGDRGFPGAIPPKATLFFDVQLLSCD